ncbi:aldo/keto reductase [uncultured Mucilaginibacter sp.]|uniref:aldo/keto reductase n=1 Tax=uncultured Mucilaginibacter sp. TaxID=797541 RepID=UPI00260F4006|nr:aldo/keto reductase [uncultured Mucilaginibacter sp.]
MKYLKSLNIKTNGLRISRIGLGGTGIAADSKSQTEGIATIHAALNAGITFLNTADFYSSGAGEMLIKEALKSRKREEVFISVKFGAMTGLDGRMYGLDVRPQAVKNYLGYTLKRLGTDYIDLYQPARIDSNIPVEETIGAVADLVKAGHVKNVGISEVDAATLRKANATYPISLVEVQYSLLNRSIEADLLPAAQQLGIGVVAFGVLFNGLIGGTAPQEKLANLGKRMSPDAVDLLSNKLLRMDALKEIADEKGITLSQLAIAWVLSKGEDVMTIVGAKTPAQLNDVVKVIDVDLSDADIKRIEQIFPMSEATSSYMLEKLNIDKNGLFKR